MARLSAAELEQLGGAFAYGHEGARAKRLFQEGLGATEADDLSLALGFPMLVELGPDVEDPGGYARARICLPTRRLEPWPRNAAVRAARALVMGWEIFPDTFKVEAERELAGSEGLGATEVRAPLGFQTLF